MQCHRIESKIMTYVPLNSYFTLLTTYLFTGHIRSPRSLSGRIVVMFWWWFAILILSSYIASLTKFVGVSPLGETMYVKDESIKSLRDLSKSNIPFAVISNSSTEHFFFESSLPDMLRLGERFSSGLGLYVDNFQEGIDLVTSAKRQTAFITDFITMQKEIDKQCDLYMVQDFLLSRHFGLAFKPGFRLAKPLNRALLTLQENGKLGELNNKWFEQGRCEDTDTYGGDSNQVSGKGYALNLSHFSGAFLPLAVGLVLGLLITVVEVLIYRYAEKVNFQLCIQFSQVKYLNMYYDTYVNKQWCRLLKRCVLAS